MPTTPPHADGSGPAVTVTPVRTAAGSYYAAFVPITSLVAGVTATDAVGKPAGTAKRLEMMDVEGTPVVPPPGETPPGPTLPPPPPGASVSVLPGPRG